MLELWKSLGDLPTGVAIGAIILYFYNQMAVRYLDDRAEWSEFTQQMIDRYDRRVTASVEATVKTSQEMHALRGRIQEIMSRIETRLATIDNQTRGRQDG